MPATSASRTMRNLFAHDMKARGHGRIMNVASTAAFEPVPYMAAYAATKAFVLSLSESVNFELKGTGVTVTTLCPGVTESKFHQRANTQNTLQKARILPQATAHDVAEYGYKMLMRGKPLAIHKAHGRQHNPLNHKGRFPAIFDAKKIIIKFKFIFYETKN